MDNIIGENIVVGEDGSYYDGGYWSFIGHNLALVLGTSVTAGIAYPWLRCWYQRWLSSHTVISGKRMRFDGKGGELFGKYILWLILSFITCGIYSLWLNVNLKKWISEHSFFEGEPDNNSYFDGTIGDYFITKILSALAFIVPFAGPAWSNIIMTRWWVRHTVIDSRRLVFDGAVGDLFIKYLLWGLLTLVTCGIFSLFAPVKYLKWETEHTLDENETNEAKNAKINYNTQIHTDAVMIKSMDAEKLNEIKGEMLNDARRGIEIGCGSEALLKLESAIRFADMLKEAGVELTEEEEGLIYDCTVLARKLKAAKPVKTGSKKWMIVIAVIAAVLLLLGIIGGAVIGLTMLMPSMDIVSPFREYKNNAGMTEINLSVDYYSFKSNLQYYSENDGFSVQEVATGVDGCVLVYTSYNGGETEVTLQCDDYGNINKIEISALRSPDTDYGEDALDIAENACEILGIYNYESYTEIGAQTDYYGSYEVYSEANEQYVKVAITPDGE